MENLVILTVRSTHFYLLDFGGVNLLIDAGWAGSLPAFRAELKRNRMDVGDIHYVMPTHHHPDHAGLVQEIKNAGGARLIIHEVQIPFLKELEAFHKGKAGAAGAGGAKSGSVIRAGGAKDGGVVRNTGSPSGGAKPGEGVYVPIQVAARDIILRGDTRAALSALGIAGEVILTPGHSDDSISFVSAGGLAFMGDLTLPGMAEEANAPTVAESWRRLLAKGAHTFYPAHGNPGGRAMIEGLLASQE